MAKKFTSKDVNEALDDLFVDLTPEEMVISTKEGKGKKAKEVVDDEATFENIKSNLLYYRGLLDGVDIAESVLPDGSDEHILERKTEFDTLFAYAEENYPDEMEEFVESMGVESFGTYDADDAEEEDDEEVEDAIDLDEVLSELELADLKKVAKALGIKVLKKDDEDSLIEKISESEEDDVVETLTELGFIEEEEIEEDADSEDDVVEDEESDDEEIGYSDMSLSELRAECKERGIKYTPKQKADALIELLEADDANSDVDEDEETEEEDDEIDDEEVSEDELDEILDEEFEDETLEEEESASNSKKGKLPPKKKK